MTLKELRELLDLLIERGIHEFEMERGNLKIRVKRMPMRARLPPGLRLSPWLWSRTELRLPLPGLHRLLPGRAAPVPVPEAPPPEAGKEEAAEEVFIVKSPMVGTLYRLPTPMRLPL